MKTADISPQLTAAARDDLRAGWGWFIALGVVLLVLGGIAFANILLATVVSVYYVGILMLLGGIAQIVQAFRAEGWARLPWLVGGLIYGVAGVATFVNPLLASAVLTLVLAFSLIVAGILRIVFGVQIRPQSGWGWVVAAGVVTLLAGLVIVAGWPVNSLFILGLILAIDLIFQGWAVLALGLALRR